jgi:hypothetical protein
MYLKNFGLNNPVAVVFYCRCVVSISNGFGTDIQSLYET